MSKLSRLLFGKKPQRPAIPQLTATTPTLSYVTSELMNIATGKGRLGGREEFQALLKSITGRAREEFADVRKRGLDILAKRGMGLAGSEAERFLSSIAKEQTRQLSDITARLSFSELEAQRRMQSQALRQLLGVGERELSLLNQQKLMEYQAQMVDYQQALAKRESRKGDIGALLSLGLKRYVGGVPWREMFGGVSQRSGINEILELYKTIFPNQESFTRRTTTPIADIFPEGVMG